MRILILNELRVTCIIRVYRYIIIWYISTLHRFAVGSWYPHIGFDNYIRFEQLLQQPVAPRNAVNDPCPPPPRGTNRRLATIFWHFRPNKRTTYYYYYYAKCARLARRKSVSRDVSSKRYFILGTRIIAPNQTIATPARRGCYRYL